jgi:hypothetical protein
LRILTIDEEVGLIGYPEDGDYLVMFDENSIRGGERVGYLGADAAVQASALPKYYPAKARLAVANIEGNRLLSIRDYRTGEHL